MVSVEWAQSLLVAHSVRTSGPSLLSPRLSPTLLTCDTLVFETELLGIDGVPKPESIVLKTSTTTDVPVETAKNFGEKIAEKFAEATDAAKTMLKDTMKDTDDAEHVEL